MYAFMIEMIPAPLGLQMHGFWQYAILAAVALAVFTAGRQPLERQPEAWIARGILRLPVFVAIWIGMYALLAAAQWVLLHWVTALGIGAVAVIVMFVAWITVQGLLSRV